MTEPQDASASEIRLALCRSSFPWYCDYVHGRKLYRHQLAWIDAMLKPGARILIVAPPESFKSSTMRMLLEWCIGREPEEANLLTMNTASQAQRQVMSIAETIEHNPRFKEVFPWVEPNPKRGWSHELLFIKRQNEALPDPTLYGTGIDGPYQGSHVKRLVVDDPTDQQDVASSATMEGQRSRLRGVLLDRLIQGGSFWAILTRWGEADLVRDFKEMGFEIMEHPIEGTYPWGRLLCPEVFGDDRIMSIRQVKGGQLFQLTYMCNPSASEGAVLKREWWRIYSEIPETEWVGHFWDLSTGQSELGDYSAFQSWGVAKEGYYLLDAGRWRMGLDTLAAKMKLLYEQSRPRAQMVVVEEAGSSIPVIQYLRAHTRLPLVTVKPGTANKVARVQGVQGLIEGGRAWVPAEASWLVDFMDEMAAFPGVRYDDQVDTMSMALTYMDRKLSGGDTVPVRRRGENRVRHHSILRIRGARAGPIRLTEP